MRCQAFLLTLIFLSVSSILQAQCPASLAALQAGGNYVNPGPGPCNLDAGGSAITITGNVNFTGDLLITNVSTLTITSAFTWVSGNFDIEGTNGNLIIGNGTTGSLTVQSGNITTNDGGTGLVRVQDQSQLNISPGASLTCATLIDIYGDATIQGALTGGQLQIFPIGNMVVSGATASLTTTASGDNRVFGSSPNIGTLTVQSNATINFNGDLEIDGGAVYIQSGTLNVGNHNNGDGGSSDLCVYNGGTIQISSGAVANVESNIANSPEPFPADLDTQVSGSGSIVVDGTLNGEGTLTIYNSETTDSQLVGNVGGIVHITGAFNDKECTEYASDTRAFCNCGGNGAFCAATLPITLTSFNAVQKFNLIQLEWITTSEINNAFFTVERLTEDTTFIEIAQVAGNGTTMEVHHYTAFDPNPAEGYNYYRLKQTDFDGKSTLSELIRIIFLKRSSTLDVYPNPSKDGRVHIEGKGYQPNDIMICTLKTIHGLTIAKTQIETDATGAISHDIEVSSKGLHILQLADDQVKVFVN